MASTNSKWRQLLKYATTALNGDIQQKMATTTLKWRPLTQNEEH